MKKIIYLNKEDLKGSDLRKLNIEISLNDKCKKGHQDFYITAAAWSINNRRSEADMGGCLHEEIMQVKPELKIFVDLHGCDYLGAPTYAIGNGFYFLKTDSKQSTMNYLRISSNEYEKLLPSEDEQIFAYNLENLKIPQRWAKEAKKAIKVLETMTGEKFVNSSTKSQYTPLTEESKKAIEKLIKSGYYKPEEIKKREEKKIADKLQKIRDGLKNDLDKEISKATNEYNIKIAILDVGLPIDNFIYYNHTNEGVFNWQDSDYRSKIIQSEFDYFCEKCDYSKLPEDITFKLGK